MKAFCFPGAGGAEAQESSGRRVSEAGPRESRVGRTGVYRHFPEHGSLGTSARWFGKCCFQWQVQH